MNQSKEVNLTMDSRIISHLGEALIDDEKVALLELIKNSSDADALNCSIIIDTLYESKYGKGRILIEDDGNGMNPYIIENAFLKIATSFKKNYQKISPKFRRLAQGNKGIGRLALNQLGRHLFVKTKVDTDIITDELSEDDLVQRFGNGNYEKLVRENRDTYYSFEIDWEDYEVQNGSIEDVKLSLNTNSFEEGIFQHNKENGTQIEVLGLKGLDFWTDEKTFKELESDVLAFLNPFLDEKSNFKVKIKIDNQIIRSDVYDKAFISNTCDSKLEFKFDSFSKEFIYTVTRSSKYIKEKIDNFISEMKKYDCELVSNKIPYELYFSKFKKYGRKFSIKYLSSIIENSPKSNVKELFRTQVKDDFGRSEEEIHLPGDFSGIIYGYDFSAIAIKSETKKIIEKIVGVKLYRNNFRIFPYGNSDNDWLKMGSFNARNSGVVYKPHTTTGYVDINGEENLNLLKELTNRQGLVLDSHGKNFLLIMRELVFKNAAYEDIRFSDHFTFIRKEIKALKGGEEIEIAGLIFRKKENVILASREVSLELAKILNDLKSETAKPTLFYDPNIGAAIEELAAVNSTLQDKVEKIEEQYQNKDKQLKSEQQYFNDLLPIIGATIISETLAHEIIRLSNNVKSYSSKIRNTLNRNDTSILHDDKIFMMDNLNYIDSDVKFLSRYASLLDVNSYSKRRRYEIGSMVDFIQSIVHDSALLHYKNIEMKYELLGSNFSAKIIRDSFKIVLENFIINSTYWLERHSVMNPTITFNLNPNTKTLEIFDNGIGIHNDVSEKIFEAFVTNKPDGEGRGMGLYIVENLLSEFGATVELSPERNASGNRYKFIMTFSEDEKQ